MMTRFSVTNFKCLAQASLPLTPFHVLIGQNDAGKTSLLQAMLAFYRSANASLAKAFDGQWQGRDLVYERAAKPEIELSAEWNRPSHPNGGESPLRYGFRAEFPEKGQDCRVNLEWVEDGRRIELVPFFNGECTTVADRMGAPAEDCDRLRAIAALLDGAQMCRFYGRTMALPAAINPQRKFRMDADGFGLATLLDDLLGFNPETFIKVRDTFCHYFPQFRSVRLESEVAVDRQYDEAGFHSTSQNSGKAIYFETANGGRVRAQQASDGAMLFLGFLALAHLPRPPKLLLIEEPEIGIYPKRLQEVIQMLKKLVAGGEQPLLPQIVISTHSPHLLAEFTPEEVTFMVRQPDGRADARPLRDAPHIHERLAGGEFYLGELWYNLTEEELFGDIKTAADA